MKASCVWRVCALYLAIVAMVFIGAAQQSVAADTKAVAVVDLNKATEAQLREVPGIGEAYAKKIVAGRPYKSVDDLSKAGVPAATISTIRSRVSVTGEKAAIQKDQSKSTDTKTGKSTVADAQTVNAKADKAKAAVAKPEPINLNKATEAQLESVPGIGPTYAKKIIAGRPYKSIDDLSKAGVPATTITKIRSQVSTTDAVVAHATAKPVVPGAAPAMLDLNKATEAQLQEVPGIGETYSKKIVAGRPYKSVDDLSKAGVPAATIAKIKSRVTVGGVTAPPAKGMVWVNLESKRYHKEGSQWYGATKSGKYMNEADAIKAGYTASKQ